MFLPGPFNFKVHTQAISAYGNTFQKRATKTNCFRNVAMLLFPNESVAEKSFLLARHFISKFLIVGS